MSAWPQEELCRMSESDDLHLAPFRQDGKTSGTPRWIWSVVVNGGLYVRAYNGTGSSWYQAALKQKAGRITIAGMTKEVSFEKVADQINDVTAWMRRRASASGTFKWPTTVYGTTICGLLQIWSMWR